jgi:hypothetical protein
MATTLRSSLLPAVDLIRGIPGQLGLRLFTVVVLQRVWLGQRVGIGATVDSPSSIKVALGTFPTKVSMLSTRDVVSSNGLYTDQDLIVGPITPPYTGSTADNNAIALFDPPVGANLAEIFFNIVGPGYPAAGAWFKKISQNVTRSFRYSFICRKTAEIP